MRGVVAGATGCGFVSVFLAVACMPASAEAHGIAGVVASSEKQAAASGVSLRVSTARARGADAGEKEEAMLVVSAWRDEATATREAAGSAGSLEVMIAEAGRIEGVDVPPAMIDRGALPGAFAVSAQQPMTVLTSR